MGVFASIGTLGRTITTLLSGVMYGHLHIHSPYYAGALMMLLLWWLAGYILQTETSTASS